MGSGPIGHSQQLKANLKVFVPSPEVQGLVTMLGTRMTRSLRRVWVASLCIWGPDPCLSPLVGKCEDKASPSPSRSSSPCSPAKAVFPALPEDLWGQTNQQLSFLE